MVEQNKLPLPTDEKAAGRAKGATGAADGVLLTKVLPIDGDELDAPTTEGHRDAQLMLKGERDPHEMSMLAMAQDLPAYA